MRIFITLIVFSCLRVTAQTDTSHIQQLPFTYMKMSSKILCSYSSNIKVIQTDSDLIKLQSLCREDSFMKINFDEYDIWQRSSMGDCHARFTHLLFMDTMAKKIIWEEHNYYGGCRGARFEDFIILFRKPPAGYTFEERVILEK